MTDAARAIGREKRLASVFQFSVCIHSRLHFIHNFPTVKRLFEVKLRTFWRKHDKDLNMAHELLGERVMGPIGSKAAANLCRDGVDFNLQFWSFGTLHQLICQCMKGDTFG